MEEISWLLAQRLAISGLRKGAEESLTLEHIQSLEDSKGSIVGRKTRKTDKKEELLTVPSLVRDDGERISIEDFFHEGRVSPLTSEQWCQLPLRPVVTPRVHKEEDLAEAIFDRIIYSPHVCDRTNFRNLSSKTRESLIGIIRQSMKNQEPIRLSLYSPLGAVDNPFKRNNQQLPAMAEIDFLRRIMALHIAVQLVYPPGIQFFLINEAPAFSNNPPAFSDMGVFQSKFLEPFHSEMERLIKLVDATGEVIKLLRLDDLLWGTPEKKEEWLKYKERAYQEMREAYDDPKHPSHEIVRLEINTFISPMATCTDPYQYPVAYELAPEEILGVYEALKLYTKSRMSHVELALGEVDTTYDQLNPRQKELFLLLYKKGKDMAFQYRVTMRAREKPWYKLPVPKGKVIPYTMVTKPDKAILNPNSGNAPHFPAHGEPVLKPQGEINQSTTVTVRPWFLIVGKRGKYLPVFDPEGRFLYFVEIESGVY